nr:IS1 family transposase [Bathymodiolus platifrons methanotrophic gill symbiont]
MPTKQRPYAFWGLPALAFALHGWQRSNQRWLWHAVDYATNTVIAYVFGKRKDDVFKELKALLTPFEISRYYTDDWGAYIAPQRVKTDFSTILIPYS